MMMASQLDVGPFGEIATGEMLASGFHPIFARHTPNGALSTPVVLEGGQDAQSVVSKWCKVVSDITNPVGDDEGVDVVVGALVTAQQPPPEGTFSLQVGDFVAYLIPDIPACHQTHFIVTQVVSLQPFALANNHHASLFASGMGEVARYNPATERVVFPVKNLRDVI
jgi:hypothetical protein